MGVIIVYLPNGMRVFIWDVYGIRRNGRRQFQAILQRRRRRWFGWHNVLSFGYEIDAPELESRIDGIVCDLLAKYDRRIQRKQAEKDANARLQAVFNGKVRDVRCYGASAGDT